MPISFDVLPDAAVVTTSYVTRQRMPIFYVSHDLDEEGEVTWQFHCGNGDYSASILQLVRLDEILQLDPSLADLAALPLGHIARRADRAAEWVMAKQ